MKIDKLTLFTLNIIFSIFCCKCEYYIQYFLKNKNINPAH